MAVIELALPGQEATALELIVTVANAALFVNGIIATQLLIPTDSRACDNYNDDDGGASAVSETCPSNTVDLASYSTFKASNGPEKYRNYCLVLTGITIFSTIVFTRFLPKSKEECYLWKKVGEEHGHNRKRGYFTVFLTCLIIGVSLVVFLFSTLSAHAFFSFDVFPFFLFLFFFSISMGLSFQACYWMFIQLVNLLLVD
jgi:hypothetical protein